MAIGQRRNRRRSRPGSRTRNKHEASVDRRAAIEGIELAKDNVLHFPSYGRFERPTIERYYDFDQSWLSWKEREKVEEERKRLEKVAALVEEQQRIFGGEIGDEVSLCDAMLGVVVSLFGDIDYIDP